MVLCNLSCRGDVGEGGHSQEGSVLLHYQNTLGVEIHTCGVMPDVTADINHSLAIDSPLITNSCVSQGMPCRL